MPTSATAFSRRRWSFRARPPEAGRPAPQLILWPETAVPFLFTDRPDALAAIGEMLKPGQMLDDRRRAGRGEAAERQRAAYYNSVVAIDDSGEIVDAVDKVHLVPFGEYLPFADMLARFGVEQLVAGPMNFVAGSQRHPLNCPAGSRALPFICYEIIFPDLVAVDAASTEAYCECHQRCLVWRYAWSIPAFRQAQVRSVENGVPLLRAANTGISGVIDARGRVDRRAGHERPRSRGCRASGSRRASVIVPATPA